MALGDWTGDERDLTEDDGALRAVLNECYRQGVLDERERWIRRDSASGRAWDDELAPGEADIDDAPARR